MVCYLVGHSQMQLITESHSSAFLAAIDTAPQDSLGRGGGRENHLWTGFLLLLVKDSPQECSTLHAWFPGQSETHGNSVMVCSKALGCAWMEWLGQETDEALCFWFIMNSEAKSSSIFLQVRDNYLLTFKYILSSLLHCFAFMDNIAKIVTFVEVRWIASYFLARNWK